MALELTHDELEFVLRAMDLARRMHARAGNNLVAANPHYPQDSYAIEAKIQAAINGAP